MNNQPNAGPTTLQQLGSTLDSTKNAISSSFNEFSNQATAGVGASSDFLTSNTIIAKFAFIILVLVIFLLLFNLGIAIIGYFSEPAHDPYLIKGTLDGTRPKVITQDPKQSTSIKVLKSNNQSKGMEFTWSVWLHLNDLGESTTKYQHIFSKGDGHFDRQTGLSKVNNGPGLYIHPNTNKLRIIMDTASPTDDNVKIDIDNIPIRRWVHIVIRLQNTILDVYVNGVISARLLLNNTPKQNYGNVYISQAGGFMGKLSDLRYNDRALNIFEINKIVSGGPNMKMAEDEGNTTDYKYLSSQWYSSKY